MFILQFIFLYGKLVQIGSYLSKLAQNCLTLFHTSSGLMFSYEGGSLWPSAIEGDRIPIKMPQICQNLVWYEYLGLYLSTDNKIGPICFIIWLNDEGKYRKFPRLGHNDLLPCEIGLNLSKQQSNSNSVHRVHIFFEAYNKKMINICKNFSSSLSSVRTLIKP